MHGSMARVPATYSTPEWPLQLNTSIRASSVGSSVALEKPGTRGERDRGWNIGAVASVLAGTGQG